MQEVLLILDNLESDWFGEVRKNPSSAYYRLLTLGYSPEQAVVQSGQARLPENVSMVDSASFSAQAEKDARAFYLDCIRDFPRQRNGAPRTILEALAFKERNLWWFLGISEKNIWNDPLIHQIYALFRVAHTCREGRYREALLFIGDPLLRQAVREFLSSLHISVREGGVPGHTARQKPSCISFAFAYWLQAAREFLKLLVILALLRARGLKSEDDIPEGAIGFFSAYPGWWKDPFGKKPRDIFFNEIPGRLAGRNPVRPIVWITPWRKLLSAGKEIMEFARDRSAVLLESGLRFRDTSLLLSPKLFFSCLEAYSLSRKIKVNFGGVELNRLVGKSLFDSLTSPMFFQCLLIDRACRRIPLDRLKVLLFRLEFQPLERAILYNTLGRTKTVGFQHSALGSNFLNYVFCENELASQWSERNSEESMPLPDYIISTGRLGVEYMRRAGYPSDRVAVGGALRYSSLFASRGKMPSRNEMRKQYSLPLDESIFFVTPSPLLQETACLLTNLFRAANVGSAQTRIIIRLHPDSLGSPDFMNGIRDVLSRESRNVPYEIIKNTTPLHDYITLSDAVFLTGGTVALEAMLLGRVPVIYINDAQFSHNPMVEYPEAVLMIHDYASTLEALSVLANEEKVRRLKQGWDKPIRDMFYDPSADPGSVFLSALDQFQVLN